MATVSSADGPPCRMIIERSSASPPGAASREVAAALEDDQARLANGEPVLDIAEKRGVCAIGLPIRDISGAVVASLSIVSPYPPPPAPEIERRMRVIRNTASELSAALGYRQG